MEYTFTINLFYVIWFSVLILALYIYIKDDGDDHLTHIRHNIEMKKEWFRMLAEQNKQKSKNRRY